MNDYNLTRQVMTNKEFMRITKMGNFVAWSNKIEPETTAIALMTGGAWFFVAINCMRDGDMEDKDADGVYRRQWFTDEVWIEDNPRLATQEEIYLYLHKVGGLQKALGMSDQDMIIYSPALVGNKVVYNYKVSDHKRALNAFVRNKCCEFADRMLDEFWKDIEGGEE